MLLMFFVILIFLWLECTVTSLPLFLIAVLLLLILCSTKHNNWVFILAFLGGLVLDVSAVRSPGGTSLFLTCWLFLILLYERKYEIDAILFVIVSSFFGTFLYLWFFGYGDIFIQSIVGSFLSLVLFVIFKQMGIFYKEKIQFNEMKGGL